MTVYVVTDSTACLPPALAEEYGITVLDIHTRGRIPAKDAGSTVAGADAASGDTVAASRAATEDADAGTERAGSAVSGASTGDAAEQGETGDDTDAGRASRARVAADEGDAGDAGDAAAGSTEEEAPTTAGLGPLELTAAYARLLERGGDEGVVALHLSRELSSTWASATQAAGVFGGLVEVLDTRTAGMVLGQAAIAAAQASAAGGSLAECAAAARHVLDGAEVWLYVHRLDALSRGGRLSTAQRLLSTALAIKPILHLAGGKIELAAKTRTQSKAMARLVTFAEDAYRKAATPVTPPAPAVDGNPADGAPEVGAEEPAVSPEDTPDTPGAPGAPGARDAPDALAGIRVSTQDAVPTVPGVSGAVHASVSDDSDDSDDSDAAGDAADDDAGETPGDAPESGRPRVFTFGGDHEFRLRRRREEPVPLADLPAVPMHLDIHQAGCAGIAEDLRATLRESLPDCVVISVVDLSPALLVHTGPEAVGITLVHD